MSDMRKNVQAKCIRYVERHYPDFVGCIEQFKRLVKRFLSETSVVVDLGCGSYSRLGPFKPLFKKLIGVDVSPEAIKQNDAIDEGIVCDIQKHIPLESNSVDLVVSAFAMEHVANTSQCLREIQRILKPGGKFIILTSNVLYPAFFISKILPHGIKEKILNYIEGRPTEYAFPTFYAFNSFLAIRRLKRLNYFKKTQVTYIEGGAIYFMKFSYLLFRLTVIYEKKFLDKIGARVLLPYILISGQK